ncbi:GH25 family lysozyme [Levilactobacillus tujiorum]|uniref:Lyzozyme M1 (1,4-beta-N-acetylmuramidase) n=1 Tax=Levilactobacillus tujiorum TaxID=2912243 RepID=A0ABX1L6D6_9LACO|nr:Lyzozyme M1 (1,4-beta-N-acetylmuramidase) [Levilactobacillus tujiorum]NLR12713.1 Lyzozyme M1 (1,4-beta-N-acetylmuramidase) [Lactobacillus sp. HBUAS51387]NLR30628.1 Lyzozyme M1 (1,4-beta-N-acetylmuramidase) [Levilactobacillus tujiorum]
MKRRDYQPIYDNTFRRRRRSRRWLVTVLMLILIIGGGWGWYQWDAHQRAQVASYPVRGVTVNQDSGYLDFQQLAKHETFVYLQATSGATYTDDDFSDNYSRSQGASIQVGVAHTFSFTTSAQRQYAHFTSTVKRNTGTLPIMVAVSYYGKYNSGNSTMATQGQKLKQLVTRLNRRYHQGVVIFASRAVLNQFVKPVLPQQDYWTAGGKLSGHSQQVKLIEYQANGTVTQNGQELPVARSVFNGSQREWHAFTK